jgi:N-acetylneuraminic acid mutarotase
MLRELFEALDNDPFVVAETLARPALVDRRIRKLFAQDERWQEATRRRVRAAIADVSGAAELPTLGASYLEITWRGTPDGIARSRRAEVVVDKAARRNQVERLARVLGTTWGPLTGADLLDRLPLMTVSALQESDAAFFVTALIARDADSFTEAIASWPKTSFDGWWAKHAASTKQALAAPEVEFVLPTVTADGGCTPDTWLLPPSVGQPPTDRYQHTAVWTGSEMIVWGGLASGGVFPAAGGRYDPATHRWTPTTTTQAPTGRVALTSVWTGTEMIVFGGWSYAGGPMGPEDLGVGGNYNPTADSWRPTASDGAATPRHHHTAVWTGEEMIVWGGELYGMEIGISAGGRYDPATSSWSTTTLTGVPSGRSGHTAVWTGSNMVVWGGGRWDGGIWYGADTGALYDPTTDSWEATEAIDAPAPRNDHTAVWTGSEMIVWGGESYLLGGQWQALESGGRYDPSGRRWEATAVPSAPSSRVRHTAVWTGDEMIVWGGSSGLTYFDTGGRYDPFTENWLETTTHGAASGREDHTAVWTGDEMIVWGGYSGSYEGDGGHYCAASCESPGTWYLDSDGDDHGTVALLQYACEQPAGFAALPGDCDDDAPTCTTDCTSDTDADSIRDCPDTCLDIDGDGYGDPGGAGDTCIDADGCPDMPFAAGSDLDDDGEGDPCDMDDGTIYILLHDPDVIEWQWESGFESWNLYRGDLRVLREQGLYTQDPTQVPLATTLCGLSEPWNTDVDPGAGEALFYLTTGNYTGTGAESGLGTDSDGIERVNASPCP